MKAVDRWGGRGNAFSTFAVPTIRGEPFLRDAVMRMREAAHEANVVFD